MATHQVVLDRDTENFYSKIAYEIGLPIEQVLSDALSRFAGELAAAVLSEEQHRRAQESVAKNLSFPPVR